MMNFNKLLFLAALMMTGIAVLSLPTPGECESSYQYNYQNIIADFTASADKSINIAVCDQRSYILSGKKKPEFLGLVRSRIGIPSDATTESGKSLAEDLTSLLSASLTPRGYHCRPIPVLYSDSNEIVMNKLQATPSDLLVLLTLNEWKSDASTTISLLYDLNLKIFDQSRSVLAEKSIKGADELEGKYFGMAKHAKKTVPDAFKKKLEELFNAPEIVKALGN